MRVLGLDLSTRRVGWSILDSSFKVLESGDFSVPTNLENHEKIHCVVETLRSKLEKVDEVCVEDVFCKVFRGKMNIEMVKFLARLRGALEEEWFKRSGKQVYVMMASGARPFLNLKGNCHKVDVQFEVCARYGWLPNHSLSHFRERIVRARQDEKRNNVKKQLEQISKEIEKGSGISEHIADSIVVAVGCMRRGIDAARSS